MTPLLALDKVSLTYEYEAGLATITLSDPAGMNVMGHQMGADLRAATVALAEIAGLRAVLLRAEGKHFCGGGDLKEMQAGMAEPARFFEVALTDMHAAVNNLADCPVPTIAAVQGFAAGAGANIPLACDLVICGEDAQFFQAFVQVGLSCDSGGAYFLPRMIGDKRALYYLLTGARLPAVDALQMGLISKVVPNEELQEEALKLARQMAEGPTAAYARIRRLVRDSRSVDLSEHLDSELASQIALAASDDFTEGVRAFLAKEKPSFQGH